MADALRKAMRDDYRRLAVVTNDDTLNEMPRRPLKNRIQAKAPSIDLNHPAEPVAERIAGFTALIDTRNAACQAFRPMPARFTPQVFGTMPGLDFISTPRAQAAHARLIQPV